MRFSTQTTSWLLLVVGSSCILRHEVTSFSFPGQSKSKSSPKAQPTTDHRPRHHPRPSKLPTELFYAPKRQLQHQRQRQREQDEESKTKLHYVSKRTKKEDTTDLYYAPSTMQEYETPFVLDKFVTSSGKIINPFRESDGYRNSNGDGHSDGDGKINGNGNGNGNEDDHELKQKRKHAVEGFGQPFFFANVLDMVPDLKVHANKGGNGDVTITADEPSTTAATKATTKTIATTKTGAAAVAVVESEAEATRTATVDHRRALYDDLYDDLPTAVGYATSLSIACMASGVTKAANILAAGLEVGAKVSQQVETSFAEIAVDIKQRELNLNLNLNLDLSDSRSRSDTDKDTHIHTDTDIDTITDTGANIKIGERVRDGFKHSPGAGAGSGSGPASNDDPLPELVQSLFHRADKVVSTPSELWSAHLKKMKKTKIASVPPPANGKIYYSPFEACNILYHHEMDQGLDKPKAMKIMLEEKYVPVGRSQLYNVFRQFKQGKITEEKQWGQRGRPRKVSV